MPIPAPLQTGPFPVISPDICRHGTNIAVLRNDFKPHDWLQQLHIGIAERTSDRISHHKRRQSAWCLCWDVQTVLSTKLIVLDKEHGKQCA